jgi:hypothetical protein
MTITQQIEQIITEVKSKPNSYPRNKVVSNLEDAKVWAKELEVSNADPASAPCTCGVGYVDANCPTHGDRVKLK